MAIDAAFAPKLQALEQRGQALNLDGTLSGAGLTSSAGRAKGREVVAQMRQMLAERRDLVRQYHEDTAALMTPQLEAALGSAALGPLRSRLDDAQRTAKQLDTARTDYVNAVDAVLSWAEQQGSAIRLENDQVALHTKERIAHFRMLVSKVDSASADDVRLYDEMVTVYEQYQKEMVNLGNAGKGR